MNQVKQLTLFKFAGFGAIVLLLFFVRLVSFNTNVLNHDELEWLYGIERTWQDARPFIGFEAHTSGPLSIYFLSIIKLFVSSPTTLHLRLFGFVFFIIPTCFILFRVKKNYWNFAGLGFLFALLSIQTEDFFSYNTEFQILLFTAILYVLLTSSPSLFRVICYSILIVFFFFIKIQVVFILAFYGIAMACKLLYTRNFRLFYYYISLVFLVVFAILLYLHFTNTLNEAYYIYIEKNIFYSDTISTQLDQWHSIVFTFLKYNFHFFVYPILCILCSAALLWYSIRESINFNRELIHRILTSRLFVSFCLYVFSLLTVLYSKNNFIHYYIVLFFPMSIFFSEIYFSLSQRPIFRNVRSFYLGTLFVAFMMHFSFYNANNTYKYLMANHQERKRYKLGHEKGYLVNSKLTEWLLNHREGHSNGILSLGWFSSQMLNYELGLSYSPVYRSANFFWYLTTFNHAKEYFFKREEANLMQDIFNNPPYYIVDCEEILDKTEGGKFSNYVQANYVLVKSSYDYKIYQRQPNDISKYNKLP